MFSQVFARPEASAGVADEVYDIAADPLMTAIYTDLHVTTGDLVCYNYFHQTQEDPAPYFPDWFGYPSFSDDTSWSTAGILSPDSVSGQLVTDHTMPSPPAGLIPQKPSCRQASPFFDNANRKWCCDACGKHFRGYYECNRHTQHAGKRARCLACDKEINSREDSLRRHYSKFCKSMDLGKNSGNVRFEDAFVHL